ncbi:tRNA (adenosine(37)-N6)-threonylcarbamoyltransferase complex ATPase subunit type 1 TsaE [Campylobacter insulaenigrae]|uniref:tRNA (adenosine(37)-N6)-threonylcarbamoyltransferase complex ATPase subunit type 1 TsaE n=1 Tax=Campylobacter insulaenigrae TaxID=260714 RepID=UPI0021520027|nr:tRNA (adenosine(37)-N6)-threonylcarbamoyltransferase complex ATPase subunit type 1 TsaE [Campylobacter insulaenigrae]MCR6573150.1 tRNA (adenosine(37)-N6)-threonylcarbamoyltransferase complex ATPase subunit type 1 TsaE [Campylobacter insulaenigrae]MCR6574937.1 tRNA (adenosine(37)-N6)-threonylcarbamoyltransferase complex ATPase subunit type 1 TsaE [Campylobacter insulaenigrae]MCR6579020.1 tRNA (adenosine(37)-N6)-threonylcarbamoyltransferase complex ATPase subunit type 1 TsaE [Campylobacter insu
MKELVLKQDELETLFRTMPKNGVVILKGELASGKTTLVQNFAKFLNISQKLNSPTFSIMQSYPFEDGVLYHYDIYQEGFDGLVKNGLIENFFEDGLHLVEWGDEKLKKYLDKYQIFNIILEIIPYENKRKYIIYE